MSATAGSAAHLFAFLISAASRHAGLIIGVFPPLEEAIDQSEPTEERWVIAELLRVKGEIIARKVQTLRFSEARG